jgi:hypothetical protein
MAEIGRPMPPADLASKSTTTTSGTWRTILAHHIFQSMSSRFLGGATAR